MKNLPPYLLAFATILIVAVSQKQENIKMPLGTVIYSVLPPDKFEVDNPGWVLMDGNDSALFNTPLSVDRQFTKMPQGQGMFIRGIYAKDPNHRNPGDIQDEQINTTRLTTNNEGSDHSHIVMVWGWHYGDPAGVSVNEGRIMHMWGGYQKGTDPNGLHYQKKITEGKHTHNILFDNKEGKETRPKNIALYTYIYVGTKESQVSSSSN